MENNKYMIQRNGIELFAQWDQKTIIFESKEDANEFIKSHYDFFGDEEYDIVIVPEEDFINYSENMIYFKDVIDTEEYKESCIYKV